MNPSGADPPQQAVKVTAAYVANLRRRSRNRESHDEIAELESELRRAYNTKSLEAQIAEREVERYIENIQRQQAAKLEHLEQQLSRDDAERRRSEDLRRTEDYRKCLQQQITEKKQERESILAEERREREILTEVDRMREEYEAARSLEKKNELAERLRRECMILQEIREIRRQQAREAEEKKELEDLEYEGEIERRAVNLKKLREEQREKREQVTRDLANALIDVERRRGEREALVANLVAADVKLELAIREKEEGERRARLRRDLAAGLEEQILFTERCKLRFLEQDRAFAEEIMRKIMEDERTERLTAEKRRRMQLQFREDLARLVEDRRRIRESEIERMEEEAREERRREMDRMDRVREERERLLEQHAFNVADFINKGVLTEREREIIAELVKNRSDKH